MECSNFGDLEILNSIIATARGLCPTTVGSQMTPVTVLRSRVSGEGGAKSETDC